jgi:hypothetical protein
LIVKLVSDTNAGIKVIHLVGRAKETLKPRAAEKDKLEVMPLLPSEKYSGRFTWEIGVEKLKNARKYIGGLPPGAWGDNWGDIRWLTEETLSRAIDELRPNIREVGLPRPYPEEPGSNWRRHEYLESLRDVSEVASEILKSAGAECGEEFQEMLKGLLIKQLRRKDATRLAKPDKKVNLEMIRILRETSGHCTPHPKQIKELAPGGKNPGRWAQRIGVQLSRFCERVCRVWQRSDSAPLEKIHFIPRIKMVFFTECSLRFPDDICVAQAAIDRGEEVSRKRKQHKLLSKRAAKPPRH